MASGMEKDEYEKLCQRTSSALEGLGHLLGKLVEAPPDFQGADGHPLGLSTAQLRQDAELDAWYQTYYNLKDRLAKNEFSVAILALTKSGKSTLLNAIIGNSLLPVSNAPETARITSITHVRDTDVNTPPKLTYTDEEGITRTTVGESEIRSKLLFLNKEVRARRHVHSDEGVLDLAVPLVALNSWGADKIALRLLDTPGPNEAGEEDLRHEVERLLDTVDAVIYLLDYTKLKTQEEATLLQRLKEINPQLVHRLSQRLFFVVNKADVMHTAEGMKEDDTREYVAELVTRTLQQEGFRLEPEQVLLVSAHDALLARLELGGLASPEEHNRFLKLQFGRQAKSKTRSECVEAAFDMFQSSGVAKMEDEVFGFLLNNTGVLKVLATVDNIFRVLAQVANVAAASSAALQQDVNVLQAETERLSVELNQVLSEFGAVQSDAEQVQGEVIELVRFRMQTLKETLFERINAVLSIVESDTPLPAITGRWLGVYRKFVSFFGSSTAGSTEAGEVQHKLRELHEEIKGQLDAEVREFWYQLELATNQHQYALVARINKQLERLSRSIEAVVGEILDVRLEAVNLKIEPPTAGEYHESLNQLFHQGIGRKTETKSRTTEERVPVWTKHHYGLCRWGYYYKGEETVRSVTKLYTETTYEMKPDKIREYFINMVDERVETSIRYVKRFVEDYMAARINSARERVVEYGQRYSDTMLTALATSKQGEEARLTALASVQANLATLQGLQAACKAIEAEAAQKFPEALAGAGADQGWNTVDWEYPEEMSPALPSSPRSERSTRAIHEDERLPNPAPMLANTAERSIPSAGVGDSEADVPLPVREPVIVADRAAGIAERDRGQGLASLQGEYGLWDRALQLASSRNAAIAEASLDAERRAREQEAEIMALGQDIIDLHAREGNSLLGSEARVAGGSCAPGEGSDADSAGTGEESGVDASDEELQDDDYFLARGRLAIVDPVTGAPVERVVMGFRASPDTGDKFYYASDEEWPGGGSFMPRRGLATVDPVSGAPVRRIVTGSRDSADTGEESDDGSDQDDAEPQDGDSFLPFEAYRIVDPVTGAPVGRVATGSRDDSASKPEEEEEDSSEEEQDEEEGDGPNGQGGSSGDDSDDDDAEEHEFETASWRMRRSAASPRVQSDAETDSNNGSSDASHDDEVEGGDDSGDASDNEDVFEGETSEDESHHSSEGEESEAGSDSSADDDEGLDGDGGPISRLTMYQRFFGKMKSSIVEPAQVTQQAPTVLTQQDQDAPGLGSPRASTEAMCAFDHTVTREETAGQASLGSGQVAAPTPGDATEELVSRGVEGSDGVTDQGGLTPAEMTRQEEIRREQELFLASAGWPLRLAWEGNNQSGRPAEVPEEDLTAAAEDLPLAVQKAEGVSTRTTADQTALAQQINVDSSPTEQRKSPVTKNRNSAPLLGMFRRNVVAAEEAGKEGRAQVVSNLTGVEPMAVGEESDVPDSPPGLTASDCDAGSYDWPEGPPEEASKALGATNVPSWDKELERLGFTEVPPLMPPPAGDVENKATQGVQVQPAARPQVLQAESRPDLLKAYLDLAKAHRAASPASHTSSAGSPWSHISQQGSQPTSSPSPYASPRGAVTPGSTASWDSCGAASGELPVSSAPPPSLSDTETHAPQQASQIMTASHVPPRTPKNAPALLPADLLKSDYASANGDSPRPSVGSDEDWDMVEAQ